MREGRERQDRPGKSKHAKSFYSEWTGFRPLNGDSRFMSRVWNTVIFSGQSMDGVRKLSVGHPRTDDLVDLVFGLNLHHLRASRLSGGISLKRLTIL